MSKKTLFIVIAVLVVAAAGFWGWKRSTANAVPTYRFATVERGDLEAAVAATGTLSAVTTVQVGTQVSGKVVEIRVDFNDHVKKGQLIARIDPTLSEQSVRDAQAGLERNEAEAEQSDREFQRNEQLFQRKVLTEIEFNNAKYARAVARANVKSAQVTLDRARQNLSYTQIYAPIDGIVVERTVELGQTVVASMSTPQIFLIANDLSQMQILASVDESDIGQINEGQAVRFSVQAYPNEHFTGEVRQVRLQSKTTENVVNYTVVVRVANKSGKLRPGMTATLDFLTGTASDALLVPNAALRFRPSDEMRAAMFKRIQEQRAANGGGANGSGANGAGAAAEFGRRASAESGGGSAAAAGSNGGGGFGNGQFAGRAAGANGAGANGGGTNGAGAGRARGGQLPPMLWYLDDKGQLSMARVHPGLTDGQKTVVESERIKEGMQVIVAVNTPASAAQSAANPFGGNAGFGGGPPGGNFGGGNNLGGGARRF
ncbi:MAG: efflux RND transporter periplasmic adaptor subunit [Gammaproteobacteria bacterium]